MEYAEGSEKILAFMTKKAKIDADGNAQGKTKMYFNDLSKELGMKPREAKKIVNKMVTDEKLVLWSSGSTTMYSLPGVGKQAAADGES